jgi:hypothetical protein
VYCCCCALSCRLISYIYPSRNQELVEKLQAKKATVIGEQTDSIHMAITVGKRTAGWLDS